MTQLTSAQNDTQDLIEPHGGTLVNRLLDGPAWENAVEMAKAVPSIDLTPRQIADVELLTVGGLSPLTGFMGSADYRSVIEDTRLADGTVWPIPVALGLTDEQKAAVGDAKTIGAERREGRARVAPRRGNLPGRPGCRSQERLRRGGRQAPRRRRRPAARPVARRRSHRRHRAPRVFRFLRGPPPAPPRRASSSARTAGRPSPPSRRATPSTAPTSTSCDARSKWPTASSSTRSWARPRPATSPATSDGSAIRS